MIMDPELMESKLSADDNRSVFERNLQLIRFDGLDNEMTSLEVSSPTYSWDKVRDTFSQLEFNSIVNDKSWKKFTETFDNLWAQQN